MPMVCAKKLFNSVEYWKKSKKTENVNFLLE